MGKRRIHLVEKHWDLLIQFSERSDLSRRAFWKWLERRNLPEDCKIIADRMRQDREVILPRSYYVHFFDYPGC